MVDSDCERSSIKSNLQTLHSCRYASIKSHEGGQIWRRKAANQCCNIISVYKSRHAANKGGIAGISKATGFLLKAERFVSYVLGLFLKRRTGRLTALYFESPAGIGADSIIIFVSHPCAAYSNSRDFRAVISFDRWW